MNNNEEKYSIPDGGEFNLYCRFDKNLNLELIKQKFEIFNIKCEYEISETDMWFCLRDSANAQVVVMSENYGLEKDEHNNLIKYYVEDFGSDDEKIDIFKKVNSNYFFDARNQRESVLVCVLAYFLSEQTDLLLYDCYNGCYLDKNDLKSIFIKHS